MKSFLVGLAAILVIGIVILAIRGKGLIPTISDPSPSPSGIPSNWDMAPEASAEPTPTPRATPTSSPTPSTKGGLPTTSGEIKGTTTTTTTVKTTTTTTQVSSITVLESADCRLNATSIIRNISSKLTIKYALKDNYSAKVTIWKTNGETVLNQTLVTGSGILKEIDTRDDLKFQVVSEQCEETSDTWLRLTAEK